MTMEWNKEQVVETVDQDSSTPEKIAPVCRLCGQKHWPLDPSCPGKKGAKAKSKAEKKAKNNNETKPRQNVKQFAEKIANIKRETAQTITEIQKRLNAEIETKTKAQTRAQKELKARIKLEKRMQDETKSRAETEARANAEVEKRILLETRTKQEIESLNKEISRIKEETAQEISKLKKTIDVEIKAREKVEEHVETERTARKEAEQKAISETEARIAAEKSFQAKLNHKTKQREAEILELRNELRELEKQRQEMHESLSSRIQDKTEALDRVENELKASIEREKEVRSRLRQKSQTYQQELSKALEQAKKLANEQDNLKQQLEIEKQARKHAEAKAEQEAEKRKELQKEIETLRHEIKVIERKHTEVLSRANEKLKNENVQRVKTEGMLKSELQEKQNSVQQQILHIQEQHDQIQTLKEQMELRKKGADEEMEKLRNETDAYAERLKQIKDNLKTEVEARKKAEKLVQSETSKRNKQEAVLQKKIQALSDTIHELKPQAQRSTKIAKIESMLQKELYAKEKLQQRIKALTEAEKQARRDMRSETRAKRRAEKAAETEKQARKEDRKNLEQERKKRQSLEKRKSRYMSENRKKLRTLRREKKKILTELDSEIRARIKDEEAIRKQSELLDSIEEKWQQQLGEKAKGYEQKVTQLQQQNNEFETELAHTREKLNAEVKAKVKALAKAQQYEAVQAEAHKRIESLEDEMKRMKSEFTQALARNSAESEKMIDNERQARLKAEEKARLYARTKLIENKNVLSQSKSKIGPQIENRGSDKIEATENTSSSNKRIQIRDIKTSISHTGTLLSTKAKDMMQKDIVWAHEQDTIDEVLSQMDTQETDYVVVEDAGRAIGILVKADLEGYKRSNLKQFASKWNQAKDDPSMKIAVKWIMEKPVSTLSPNTGFAAVVKNMHTNGMRPTPVVDEDEKVLGLVTPCSVLKIKALLKLESNPNILAVEK